MSHVGQPQMARIFRQTNMDHQENAWQGDAITGGKELDIVRMMFHNVNGLTLYGPAGIDMFVHEQQSLDVDHVSRY